MPPFDNTPGSPDGPPAAGPFGPVEFVQVTTESSLAEKAGVLFGVIAIVLFGVLLGSAAVWAILWLWMNLPH